MLSFSIFVCFFYYRSTGSRGRRIADEYFLINSVIIYFSLYSFFGDEFFFSNYWLMNRRSWSSSFHFFFCFPIFALFRTLQRMKNFSSLNFLHFFFVRIDFFFFFLFIYLCSYFSSLLGSSFFILLHLNHFILPCILWLLMQKIIFLFAYTFSSSVSCSCIKCTQMSLYVKWST